MTELEMISEIETIIRDVLDDETVRVTETTRFDEFPDWDSVAHMTMIAMMENVFGIRFSIREIEELKTVGLAVDGLRKKTKR